MTESEREKLGGHLIKTMFPPPLAFAAWFANRVVVSNRRQIAATEMVHDALAALARGFLDDPTVTPHAASMAACAVAVELLMLVAGTLPKEITYDPSAVTDQEIIRIFRSFRQPKDQP